MKQEVNYIIHHKNVNMKMMEDDLSPIHMSLYNALFLIWNRHDFDTQLSINRNDVMKLSKIGSANTYTTALKTLDSKGYIQYLPSFNPMKGSLVTFTRFDKGTNKGSGNSTGKSSDIGSNNSPDKGTDTLYKQVKQYNNLTEEQTNIILNFYDLMSSDENEKNIEFFEKYIKAYESGLFSKTEQNSDEKAKLIDFLNSEFGFNEMRFAPQQRIVFQFVTALVFKNDLDNFKNQYDAYKKYKSVSGEKSHSFHSLIGTVQNQFNDGVWNTDNWAHKLKVEKEKQDGNSKRSNKSSRSNKATVGEGGYTPL